MKSLTASPSLRNSGFEATANVVLRVRLTMRLDLVAGADRHRGLGDDHGPAGERRGRPGAAALKMYGRSAEPSGPGGVPTARKIDLGAGDRRAATSVVKRSRPSRDVVRDQLVEPGLVDRDLAALEARRSSPASMSPQMTSLPMSAKPAPATRPTYPVPMTQIFMAFDIPWPRPFPHGHTAQRHAARRRSVDASRRARAGTAEAAGPRLRLPRDPVRLARRGRAPARAESSSTCFTVVTWSRRRSARDSRCGRTSSARPSASREVRNPSAGSEVDRPPARRSSSLTRSSPTCSEQGAAWPRLDRCFRRGRFWS